MAEQNDLLTNVTPPQDPPTASPETPSTTVEPGATTFNTFGSDTYLYSKKFKEGKLFLAGETLPDTKEGFTNSPANL